MYTRGGRGGLEVTVVLQERLNVATSSAVSGAKGAASKASSGSVRPARST